MLTKCLLIFCFLNIIGAQWSDNITCLVSKCSSCSTPSQCNVCLPGSIVIGGSCVYCSNVINACIFCNFTASKPYPICFTCQNGYYLNNTSCLPCTFPCAICQDQNTCTNCLQGLYLNQTSNQCQSCQVLNCNVCSSPGNCTSCIPSYYLNGDQCLPCQFGCLECNQYQCFSCLPAYIPSIPCIPCMPNCQSCSNWQFCNTCSDGYIQSYISGCTSCTSFISNCASCTQAYYQIICDACMQGYYLNVTGNFSAYIFITNCLACPGTNCAYCVEASQGTVCVYCMEGFYIESNNLCLSCPVGCSSCYNSSSCSQCSSGYYSLGSLCVECSQHCQNCNQSTCLFCLTPFFPINNSCGDCNQVITNCSECFKGSCLVCNIGFYLQSSASCQPCQPNCQICSNSTTCYTCFSTFYLQNGSCVSCYPCATCVNSSYCITCPTGVTMGGYAIPTCPVCPNCLNCFFNHGCVQCAPKYIILVANNQNICISIYDLSALRWWQTLLILAASLVGAHFAGNAVVWLRNRTDGYLGEEENHLEEIELEVTQTQ